MKARRKRKQGTGYWQRRDWRRRSLARRMGWWFLRRRLALILTVLGVLAGGVAGSALFDKYAKRLTPDELTYLWERYKPSVAVERTVGEVPKAWEQHYRRAPEAGSKSPAATLQRERRPALSVVFAVCSSPVRVNCVVDGDTIWYHGDKIRIADINTPEISSPKCASEEALGHRAKERLVQLLNAGPFDVVRSGDRDRDRYGRLLRVVVRDGRSLGMILVQEGLAHVWEGSKRSWC